MTVSGKLLIHNFVNMDGYRIPQSVIFLSTLVLQVIIVGTNLVPGGK